MARSFRASRFRRHADVGEDVNPSAYIVNLADCMLVLACGFLVALISFYNIDVSMTAKKLDEEQLSEIEPETLDEELLDGGGSYYVEAGKVYRDPNTGVLYMVQETGESGSSDAGSDGGAADGGSAGSGSSADGSGGSGAGDAGSAASSGGSGGSSGTGSASAGASGSGSGGSGSGDSLNARANGAD